MKTSTFLSVFLALAIAAPLPALAATGSFDLETLTTSSTRPTITGEASGEKIRLVVENERGKVVYKKNRNVRDGEWSAKMTKRLARGEYDVSLYGYDGRKRVLVATSTLSITKKGATSGSIFVSPIPLLMGGTAMPGASVPVAYVKVANTGKATTSIDGFTLSENGSAPDSVVIGFATNDDKGGSRATIGGVEGKSMFQKSSVFVPLKAEIAPGKMRIFTVKAILSSLSGSSAGSQLKIDVEGVKSSAKISGTFPIRGTTFTLSR